MMELPLKVLLVEQHDPVRMLIGRELEGIKSIHLMGSLRSGADMLAFLHLNTRLPDVVIMDAEMDGSRKFRYTRWIREQYPDMSILALVNWNETFFARKMVSYGACGILFKGAPAEMMEEVFCQLIRDGLTDLSFLSNDRVKDIQVDFVNDKAQTSELNKEESRILRLLIKDYSTRQISDVLSLSLDDVNAVAKRLSERSNGPSLPRLRRFALDRLNLN